MKTLISRTAFAALLATSMGVALAPAVALAQDSPASPTYSYDTRNGTGIYPTTDGSSAQAPVMHSRFRGGLSAQASVIDDGGFAGQDPDPNVRLQLRRDSGLFDR